MLFFCADNLFFVPTYLKIASLYSRNSKLPLGFISIWFSVIKLGWYLWLLSKVSNFSDIEKFSYCWIFWSIYSVTVGCTVFNLSCLSFRIVFFWYLCVLNLFHKWKYKLGIFYSSLLCFLAPNPLQRKTSVLIAQTSLLLLNCSVFVLV